MWNPDDHRNTFLPSASVAGQALIPYQYPPPSSGLDSPSNTITGYHHPRDLPQSPGQTRPGSPSHINRGSVGDSLSARTNRSMSTPNVQGQATSDVAALALSADKRRNKLGYHRTSVACGHCRRRKIRCIAAPGDPHNRCSNCIRLKKECHFFAVDQQPLPDPQRRGSKAQSSTGRGSEESSPSTSSGPIPELPQALSYSHQSMPPNQDLGGPQMRCQRTESRSPEMEGKEVFPPPIHNFPIHPAAIPSSRAYEYPPPPPHGSTDWMAPDPAPSTVKSKTDASQPYWTVNPQESPLTPAFSPFNPNLQIQPPPNWPPSHNEASPRDDSWSAPQRSMSYSHLEGLQNQHLNTPYSQYHPPPQINDHYTTKSRALQSSGMLPAPTQTSSTVAPHEPTPATSSESHQHAHPGSSLPPVPFPDWQHPFAYPKPVGIDQYSWSGPSAPPTLHSEEGHVPPPPGYGYGDPANEIYYQPHHPGR
ncbi:Fungal Zn binuclear cluster domain containing protein [Diplocarpon rosae]|nr:Fungal Zn binuclear cluster domain containing protein [Diplocarpon rosae]